MILYSHTHTGLYSTPTVLEEISRNRIFIKESSMLSSRIGRLRATVVGDVSRIRMGSSVRVYLSGHVPATDDKDKAIDKRVWPIAGSGLLMGSAIGVVIPIMPLFIRELGLTTSQLGMIVASMGVARLLLNIPAAHLCDTIGRRPLLVGGPIMTAISMLGTGVSKTFAELALWRAVTGAGGAAQMTGSQMYLADISTTANRARTLAPSGAAFSIGFAFGPSISGLIAENYGLRAPFAFVGAAICLAALNNYIMLPETFKPEMSESKGSLKDQFKVVFTKWNDLLHDSDMRQILTMHTTFWLTSSGAQFTLLPLLAITKFGYTAGSIGGIFSAFAIIGVAGTQPAAWLADKYGRKAGMVPGSLIVSGCCIAIPFITTNEEFMAVVVAWALGNTLVGQVPVAYVSDISTPKNRSQALAMLRQAGDLGLVLGAGAISLLAEYTSYTFAFETNAAILSILTLRFAWKAKETITRKS
jgi:DHA1 family multidrug resistance protein-like MFS transporter